MAKRYARINWQDYPSVATPRNATNLNKMDKGIDDCDDAIEEISEQISGLSNSVSTLNDDLSAKLNKSGDTLTGTLNFGANIAGFFIGGQLGYYIKNSGALAFYNHDNTLLAYFDWNGNLHIRGDVIKDIV